MYVPHVSRTSKLVLGCAIVVAIVAAAVWLPIGDALEALVEWVRDLGALGIVVYSLIFVVVSLSLLPTVELYIAAGLLYGTWWGALLTLLLGVVVELCTLWLVHTRLRDRIERQIHKYPRIKALDKGIAEHPFWIVQLLRLSPLMPFGPLNYALALTKVPLWKRIVTNIIGMAPGCLAQAYLGSLLSGVGQLGDADPPSVWKHIALWGGLVTMVAAAVVTAWTTKRVLARQQRGSHQQPA
jgi:uncharacterized membrane protein YdjX (TVP38/TMEM64 family)